jgi:hypothetical protein
VMVYDSPEKRGLRAVAFERHIGYNS